MRSLCLVLFALAFVPLLAAADSLDVYVVDVEGGKAMLVVSPSGETMLIDTGWPGPYNEKFVVISRNDRNADRIAEVVKLAGVKQIDYLIITHYDADHVGNVPRTVAKIGVPIKTAMDHGDMQSQNPVMKADVDAYMQAIANVKRVVLKPGDTIPIAGLDVRVLTSAGEVIKTPLPGGGAPNEFCAGATATPTKGENPASVGLLYTFGRFRMLDIADVTKGKEYDLMCPNNPVGTVDLFMASHHGFDMSDSALLVHPLHARVAIVNNGPRKGGQPGPMQTIFKSPGMEDVWQLHYTVDVPSENNAPEQFIANPEKELSPDSYGAVNCQGKWIKVSARRDGTFTVTNSRNGFSKTYKPKATSR